MLVSLAGGPVDVLVANAGPFVESNCQMLWIWQ